MILSANVQLALMTKPTDYFHCIRVVDAAGSTWKALTTLYHEVTIDGILYTPGAIVQVDNPKMNTTVDREQFKFTLSDPSFYDAATMETNLTGYSAQVRLCFLDATTKLPLTAIEDTVLIYKGSVDNVSYSIRTEEMGEVLANIVCASPMSDLDLKKGLYLSRESTRNRNPEDSSCDTIYGGSGILQLKWGKK